MSWTHLRLALATAAILSLPACGGPTTEPDDTGPVDASSPDDVGSTHDAAVDTGRVEIDAATEVDAGLPATDAWTPDAWTQPDAPPALDACATAGEMAIRPCGRCGEASFRCEDGYWQIQTACLGEGECLAGSFEIEAGDLCSEQTRLCNAECTWGGWTETRPPGECEVGARRRGDGACPLPTEAEFEECDTTCHWDTSGVCADADGCVGTPRTTPAWAEEVCVHAGPFMRDPESRTGRPPAEIMMSAFFIDRYPVTYGRYAECWRAGACVGLAGDDFLTDPTMVDLVFDRLSIAHGAAFCAWDGGRLLPTEAQWEYAGRGPSPRTNRFPWVDDWYPPPGYCDRLRGEYSIEECQSALYYSRPGTRSYFGTERQVVSVAELTRDNWLRDWYRDPRSLEPDPFYSDGGSLFVSRGGVVSGMIYDLNHRSTGGRAFRCVRPDSL